MRGHGGSFNDRETSQTLQRLVAAPARPLRPTAADIGRTVRCPRPVAHAPAVDVVKGALLPSGSLPVFGNDFAWIRDQVAFRVPSFVEPVRPNLRHPRGRVIDVLGEVRDREAAALVLDVGKEESQAIASGIDAGLGEHVLLRREGV